MPDAGNVIKLCFRSRLKLWLRKLLLTDLLARAMDNRKSFIALERHFQLLRGDVLDRLDRLEASVLLISQATSKGLDLLAQAIEDIPSYMPYSWREYECVEYAVAKMERDVQARSVLSPEQQFKEMLGWSRMYCDSKEWARPPTERLKTLIESRLEHGKKKLSVVSELRSVG